MATQAEFRFRRVDSIGVSDAEEDASFLDSCFVDTGDLAVLRAASDPRRIVLGRTGSGKTALLVRLEQTEQRVLMIRPEDLALSYVSNSSILTFISQLGVKLDIFFRLLWRHVFTVEILKDHFRIDSEAAKTNFVERFLAHFKDRKHARALSYLDTWGKRFWEETETRIKELTTKLERDIQTSIESKVPSISFSLEGAKKLSEEQKQEVIQRAQHIVNEVQVRELSEILDVLDDVLNDPQKHYFVVIDRLDENWVEERTRYLLIRALIETARDVFKVRHVKILIALRLDLIERVFRLTRDSGFQEEKYRSLYLELNWTKNQLVQVLDSRIAYLVKQRYTRQSVGHKDLLPKAVEGKAVIDYILARTLMRPRDVIAFFNHCILQAVDSPRISVEMLRRAEGEYSRGRLRSLADEWYADYPNLFKAVELLKGRPENFLLHQIADAECDALCLNFIDADFQPDDDFARAARQLVEGLVAFGDFRRILAQVFYRVGIAGLKVAAHERTIWAINERRSVSSAEVDDETRIAVHPCFWRALGISANRRVEKRGRTGGKR